jgi:hypothetical protein
MRRDQLEHAIRRTRVRSRATGGGGGDLGAAKLCAFCEKDQNFAASLLDAGLVDPDVITARLATVPSAHRDAAEQGFAWLAARRQC